ncbi:hypothetical protein RFI_18193 [Reticulomyxa filosa]|uniref:Ubiquitin-like domain-containing protein n=1 Tax=Reticulomyxa filosa TaxID=46433 RepID=X6MYE4_RETFI|nr:hypothetical protein RFI_18193 [Reticulomyxa filosa]|eukprot:ETO19045.1 hypothetical protein RFI_18193 [Reticulomyxa filosa]
MNKNYLLKPKKMSITKEVSIILPGEKTWKTVELRLAHNTKEALVCELKRKIHLEHGHLPVHQRLTIEGNVDSFEIPPKVKCTLRVKRDPKHTLTIFGYNLEEHRFAVDLEDTILDLKFLLSLIISEKPEHIQISCNDDALSNTITLEKAGIFQRKTPLLASYVVLNHALLQYWPWQHPPHNTQID